MLNKNYESYRYIWTWIFNHSKEHSYEINDEIKLIIDYEQAPANAFLEIFPNGSIKRCLFHLYQSIYRKVQILGLSNNYLEENKFRKEIKYLMSLAYLPNTEIEEVSIM